MRSLDHGPDFSVDDEASSGTTDVGATFSSHAASGKPSDFRVQRQNKAREELERLRLRLLDLSGRNKFLNFRHSETSGTQLRIVDTTLTSLQSSVETGQELTLRGLRKPDQPKLALLQQENETAKSPVLIDQSTPRRRSWRYDASVVREVAHEQGVNTDFDLEIAGAPQRSKELRTSLFADDLERRLQGIYDKERRSAQELGISTLYLCLGFLEWYEADHSDKQHFAPLLLYPIEIKRELHGTKYRFTVRGTGDDPEVNISLIERLARDFAIRLPQFEAGDHSVQHYLESVTEATKDLKRWRVRAMATIAILNFAKLAMWKDLDPEQRPNSSRLEANDVILDVLSGGESGAISINEDEPDLHALPEVPLIVTEADSSQFAAMAEALAPRNIVIEGPPGTGKSQTITNIIAAALAKGMRVLFVAEKLAALQVVKSKIDSFGLGLYCLELHSTKARKTDVYESISQRIHAKRPTSPNVGAVVEEVEQQKRLLDNYVAALHSVHGNLGDTVHELLWREQRLRLELGAEAAKVELLHIDKAEEYSPSRLAAAAQTLDGYAAIYSDITTSYGSPSGHPWFGFIKSDADLAQRREFLARFASIGQILTSFDAACNHFAAATQLRAELTLGNWLTIAALSSDLAHRDPGVSPEVICRLQRENALNITQRLIANIEELRTTETRLGEALIKALADSGNAYGEVSQLCSDNVRSPHIADVTLGELPALVMRLDTDIARMLTLKDFGGSLEPYIGEPSGESVSMANAVRSLLENTPRLVLLLRNNSIESEEAHAPIRAICEKGAALVERQARLTEEFDVAGLGPAADLREHARNLRDAGFLWWLNSKLVLARRLYRRCTFNKTRKSNTEIAQAFAAAADTLDECEAFRGDAQAQALLGATFTGLETEFANIQCLLGYYDAARSITNGNTESAKRLRHLLVFADVDTIDAFVIIVRRPELSALSEYFSAGGWWSRFSNDLLEAQRQRAVVERLIQQVSGDSVPRQFTVRETVEAVASAALYRDLSLRVNGDGAARSVLDDYFDGVRTNIDRLKLAIDYVDRLRSSKFSLPEVVLEKLAALDRDALRTVLSELMPLWLREEHDILAAGDRLQSEPFISVEFLFGKADLKSVTSTSICQRISRALNNAEALDDWARYLTLRTLALDVAGSDLLRHFEANELQGSVPLAQVFAYLVFRSVVRSAIDKYPALNRFPGVSLQTARERFRDLDRRLIQIHREALAARLHLRRVDTGNNVGARGTWTGLALLNNEIGKQRRHIAIRDVVQRAGAALQQLKPCFMMSPLSVAQYVPPGSAEFDLVVIDEASQMKPEDALGALSRGKHAVIVGDPKQLPPTSFFEKEIEDEETLDEDAIDNESILLLAMAQYGKRRLRWHYRSRHQSLIAFSNRHFYDNDLIVFPSPASVGSEFGVRSHFIGGLYKAGGTNPDEVTAICEAAIRFMKASPDCSLGLVAINREQRELIYDEMTHLIAGDHDAKRYVDRWESTLYPFFVKNLESVQGDERDVIFISTVYGPEQSGGTVAQRFGPILGPSGWRRLNVLFTRARMRVEVFTSMMPSDVRADEKSPQGVRAFRDYLEYASTGRLETGISTAKRPDSDFEIAVGGLLEAAGYEVEPQVGVAHYFIDMAVRNPRSGEFVLGIECDGATYHSAKSARDRDRTREEALRALGWKLYRIWSTDWFADPRREFTKLERHLKALLS